ncbi:MAG: hypothetical protein ACREAU_00570 [Nitrosopumilaceae archaeon]
MDIDIDLKSSFFPEKYFPECVRASRVENQILTKHNTGVYFQTIPVDSWTNLAAIPYKEAENLGYVKIDFLHLSVLDIFESKQEIRALLKKEPNWDLLQSRENVSKLFHLHNHYDIVRQVKPKSVIEIADCLALIRPGKKHLIEAYLKDRDATRPVLYKKSKDGYMFKKSHAVSYSLTIVLQLHLIEAKAL